MPVARTLSTLIVDDHLTMRALVRNGLQQLGFTELVEADNGEQGLRMLLTHSPAPKLIISDYNMPKVDGLAFLRAVRAHGPTSTVPFILLTGQADRELVLIAKKHGVNHYLVKPFTVATLRDRVESVVGVLT